MNLKEKKILTESLKRLKVGDKIIFKCQTRWGYRKATRKVNGFFYNKPTVRYDGWSDFIVNWNEIKKVLSK